MQIAELDGGFGLQLLDEMAMLIQVANKRSQPPMLPRHILVCAGLELEHVLFSGLYHFVHAKVSVCQVRGQT